MLTGVDMPFLHHNSGVKTCPSYRLQFSCVRKILTADTWPLILELHRGLCQNSFASKLSKKIEFLSLNKNSWNLNWEYWAILMQLSKLPRTLNWAMDVHKVSLKVSLALLFSLYGITLRNNVCNAESKLTSVKLNIKLLGRNMLKGSCIVSTLCFLYISRTEISIRTWKYFIFLYDLRKLKWTVHVEIKILVECNKDSRNSSCDTHLLSWLLSI